LGIYFRENGLYGAFYGLVLPVVFSIDMAHFGGLCGFLYEIIEIHKSGKIVSLCRSKPLSVRSYMVCADWSCRNMIFYKVCTCNLR
jgi:hypothetical protein